MHRFKKCDKPDCFRLTREGTLYCCGNCRGADEGPDRFELADNPDVHPLLRHTPSCDDRAVSRAGKRIGDYDENW